MIVRIQMPFSVLCFRMTLLFCLSPVLGLAQARHDYVIRGVPFSSVKLNDTFWSPRLDVNRTVTIPTSFKRCEETGRVQNFVLAARRSGKFLTRYPFDDTDIYKTIEGASYSMVVHPDPRLDRYLDSLIAIVAAAQEPDGYLYTARTINPLDPPAWAGKERWVNESILSHELYNSGHLFEAAAAHFMATGKRNLFDVALKNADLLTRVFGPGKRNDAPGHEIVEMGLVRLYRITGAERYLNLARFFIDCRGKKVDSTRMYSQDHEPLVMQDEAVGHAVRAGYLYSGVADVAALIGDTNYVNAIDRIWANMVGKKLYITGGIGAVGDGERFGENYDLPNATAYNETCAAIANVYWNYRMFLLHGSADFIDVLERALYNNVAAGVALDGKTFFYANPLACNARSTFDGDALTRQPWFECSCCPTNLCRFLPSIPGYIYAQKQESLYVNLFIGSSATIAVDSSLSVTISQQSNYPWGGGVHVEIDPTESASFTVRLRIPGWARNRPVPSDLYAYLHPTTDHISIKVNGKPVDYDIRSGYAGIHRVWQTGDQIDYELPMRIHRVVALEQVAADRGRVALERGPIVYCLEGFDNGFNMSSVAVPDTSDIAATFAGDMLNGIEILKGQCIVSNPVDDIFPVTSQAKQFIAIPYYSWNNRGGNEMKVWLPRTPAINENSHE
jgi:DUF1680 family protein